MLVATVIVHNVSESCYQLMLPVAHHPQDFIYLVNPGSYLGILGARVPLRPASMLSTMALQCHYPPNPTQKQKRKSRDRNRLRGKKAVVMSFLTWRLCCNNFLDLMIKSPS